MYSRRNKDYWEEYPYSIPPRYSGSRFKRSDGRDDRRIFTAPQPESQCNEERCRTGCISAAHDGCSNAETEQIADYAETTDMEQRDCTDGKEKNEDVTLSDTLSSLLGSEELLIIGVIILLTVASEDGNGGMSDIVPILALLLLLK